MDDKFIKVFKLILCIAFMLLSIYFIYNHYNYKVVEINDGNNFKGIIKENEERKLIVDLRNQYNNNEIVFLVEIPNVFKIPVVQTDDNSYYLTHDLYKDNKKGGTLFLDYRNKSINDKKLIIYGYNNISSEFSFDKLVNYQDINYYENHKDIKIYTEEGERTYRIFSVFKENTDFDYTNLNSYNGLTYYEHLLKLKNKSLYETGVDIEDNSKIVILQAEDYNKNSNNKNCFLVLGVELPKEKIIESNYKK